MTGLILGRLVDGMSDRPMAATVVAIQGGITNRDNQDLRRVITDSDGVFLFRQLSAGEYSFSIFDANGGPLLGGYGVRRAGGASAPLILSTGEHAADVALRAWRSGSVSGTLLDDHGEGVAETRVSSLRIDIVGGQRRYTSANSGMTDDRGLFTISGLAPGEYTLYVPYTQITVPLSVQADIDNSTNVGAGSRQEKMRALVGVDTTSLNGSGPHVDNVALIRSSNVFGAGGPLGVAFTSPAPDEAGHVLVYPFTYLPNATALGSASTFTIDSGQDRTGVDLQVHLVPGVRISGHVTGPDGPGATVGIRLVPQAASLVSDEAAIEAARTTTDAAGDFTLLGVPTGQYVLKIARVPENNRIATQTSVNVGGTTFFSANVDPNLPPLPIPDTPSLTVAMPLTVGTDDLLGVQVTLTPGPRISGHVEYDGTSAHLTADQLVRARITLDPPDGRVSTNSSGKGQFDATGAFRTVGLVPGPYLLRVGGALGPWSLLSATVKGHDLADVPLTLDSADVTDVVITLTDRTSTISGVVRDSSGAPDGTVSVLLFPAERAKWANGGAAPRRLKARRASAKGAYTFGGVIPGEYFVIAIDDGASANWQDPVRLEALSHQATRVTVALGDQKGVDLKTEVVR
jgi:hypothetical protein